MSDYLTDLVLNIQDAVDRGSECKKIAVDLKKAHEQNPNDHNKVVCK